jgi:methylmalonyl-CoA/ethylmalonyl-CoA epimerase
MITRINHIGIVVKDLEDVLGKFEKTFGLKVESYKTKNSIKAAFVAVGDGEIEFLQAEDDSELMRPNEKYDFIHHFAFETDDIENEIEKMKKNGIKVVHDPPIIGLHGVKIAFISPEDLNGLHIELIEF